MMRTMLKSKIYYAVVSDLQLRYRGSITVDAEIMEKADLKEGEKVDVLNLNNGARLQTYIIKGKRLSGEICLNGPAARCGCKGDELVILSYGIYTDAEVELLKAKHVELNKQNEIQNTHLA